MGKMTKAQKKKRIKELVEKYQEKLLLQGWDITWTYSEKWASDDGKAAAQAIISHIYRTCDVTVWDSSFTAPNDIEHIIKHELCHCITQPLYEYCYDFINGKFRTLTDIEEQREIMTEHFAKVIK